MKPKEIVRIGVIGTSWWSDMYFLPILSNCERADLVAICGRNQERAAEMANKFGVPQVYNDYRRMIGEAGLDALVVSSPDDLHYEMVLAGLEAGLHVLCEKPLANNAEHARRMYEKAETTGLKHMVNYTWRWLPQMRYIKDLLDEGYLGRIYQGIFRFASGFAHNSDYSWRVDAERSNGVLADLGSHMIDLARIFLGDVTSVRASIKTQVEREGLNDHPLNPANDSAFALLDFSSGAHCSIQVSSVIHMAQERGISVSLYGEKGSLHTDYFYDKPDFVVRTAEREKDILHKLEIPRAYTRAFNPTDHIAAFKTESIGPRLFIDSILEDKPVEPGFRDGYLNQRVIDAGLESDRRGTAVWLDG